MICGAENRYTYMRKLKIAIHTKKILTIMSLQVSKINVLKYFLSNAHFIKLVIIIYRCILSFCFSFLIFLLPETSGVSLKHCIYTTITHVLCPVRVLVPFTLTYQPPGFLYSLVLWFGCGQQQKRHAAAPPPAAVWRRMERKQAETGGSG